MARRPAVFLDRDGTLIEERNYLSRPEHVHLLPRTAQALQALRAAGFACVLATNQSGLGRGLFTEADLEAVHAELHRQLAETGVGLDGIYYCPHVPTSADKTVFDHPDRKPGPGMLLRAARELDLDLAASWIVGDSLSDVLAGRHAGCRGSILVRSGHPLPVGVERDWPVVADLGAATAYILGVS